MRPRALDPAWAFHWPVALGFALLCVALNYPGRLNADSLFAVIAAPMPGMANNWHSATLGWFWSLPAPLLGQPVAALAMQALLFGVFAGFLPRLNATPRDRAVLAGEVLLRVVLAGSAGYVGKDTVMLLTLVVAVQLLRQFPYRRLNAAKWLVLTAVLALFLLAKVPNFLTLVVGFALILPFYIRSTRCWVAFVAAAVSVGALAVPLNRAVDASIFAARDLHPDQQLVLFDLAGISANTWENVFADIPGWPVAELPDPASCYLPNMWDSFAHWAPCGGYSRAYDRRSAGMIGYWASAIAAHPLAYAQHRLAYAGQLLTSRDHDTWGLAGRAINDASNPAALAEMRSGMAQLNARQPITLWQPSAATAPLQGLESALFRFPKAQWVGLLACLTVLLVSWLRRHDGVRFGAILAAALGTGNFAMLAVFGVADPVRYMLPTMGLAAVALLGLLTPARADTTVATP